MRQTQSTVTEVGLEPLVPGRPHLEPARPSAGKARVSVLVPVKNEETNLRRCLPALAWADEVFVVDSQSSDGTAAVAAEDGARVIPFHFNGVYPKKKNWALENLPFRYEWVLIVDADEVVVPELAEEIARRTAADGCVVGGPLGSVVGCVRAGRSTGAIPRSARCVLRARPPRRPAADPVSKRPPLPGGASAAAPLAGGRRGPGERELDRRRQPLAPVSVQVVGEDGIRGRDRSDEHQRQSERRPQPRHAASVSPPERAAAPGRCRR